ncbi:MAG: hypothetical protein K2J37_04235 [Ruminococcus sp.]|nr:hypothetical protein [Ruminococcus sp.]MDE6785072.1 hypothetical protein [Ruminococcus sp.]
MNSIYTCPHCGKKSFNPLKKAFAGQLNSPGKVCIECGRKCVNGKGATIFNAVYCILAFAGMVVLYLNAPKALDTEYEWIAHYEMLIGIGIIVSMFVIPKIVNAFFFRLSPAIRIEAVK